MPIRWDYSLAEASTAKLQLQLQLRQATGRRVHNAANWPEALASYLRSVSSPVTLANSKLPPCRMLYNQISLLVSLDERFQFPPFKELEDRINVRRDCHVQMFRVPSSKLKLHLSRM